VWYRAGFCSEELRRTEIVRYERAFVHFGFSLVQATTATHRQAWLCSSTSTYHSTDLLTARGVAHLVVHGTTGSTSYETIPHVPLETYVEGVKLGRIPSDLRSDTSCLRSTTSNNRSCTLQLRSGTFLLECTSQLVEFVAMQSLTITLPLAFIHDWSG